MADRRGRAVQILVLVALAAATGQALAQEAGTPAVGGAAGTVDSESDGTAAQSRSYDPGAAAAAPLTEADTWYEQALAIRDTRTRGPSGPPKAFQLLFAAAGIEAIEVTRLRKGVQGTAADVRVIYSPLGPEAEVEASAGVGRPGGAGAAGDPGAPADPDLPPPWRHAGAVRELIYMYREGDGVRVNPGVAHKLLLELAAGGDPEAAAEVAIYDAAGIQPLLPPEEGDGLLRSAVARAAEGAAGRAGRAEGGDRAEGLDGGSDPAVAGPAPRPLGPHARGSPRAPSPAGHWHVSPGDGDGPAPLFLLTPRDEAAALARLTVAARSGDPLANSALGHRHAHGLGVERSCLAAAAYWAAAAEAAVGAVARGEAGATPPGRLRVSGDAPRGARAGRRARASAAPGRPGAQPDPETEALHYAWFADWGNAEAARAAASALARAGGGPRETERAVRFLRQAADAGDGDAAARLGHAAAAGDLLPRDDARAVSWFWTAAERGSAPGFLGLGVAYLTGMGVPTDPPRALKYFAKAVESGQGEVQAEAYFYLGSMHLHGLGTPPDAGRAASLWDAAAAGGHALAALNLGHLLLGGQVAARVGGPRPAGAGQADGGDPAACERAVALYARAAQRALTSGPEGDEDLAGGEDEWALLNYLKAAETGDRRSAANAAWMLDRGRGYSRDAPLARETSRRLARLAAAQGSVDAALLVGDQLWEEALAEGEATGPGDGPNGPGSRDAEGEGSPGPPAGPVRASRSVEAYRAALRLSLAQGLGPSARALFSLGWAHARGIGAAKDRELALRHLDRAAEAEPDAATAVLLAKAFVAAADVWEKRLRGVLPGALVARAERAVRGALGEASRPRGPGLAPRAGADDGEGGSPDAPPALLGSGDASPDPATSARVPAPHAWRLASLALDRVDAALDSAEHADLIVIAGLGLLLALIFWRRRVLRVQQRTAAVRAAIGEPNARVRRRLIAPLVAPAAPRGRGAAAEGPAAAPAGGATRGPAADPAALPTELGERGDPERSRAADPARPRAAAAAAALARAERAAREAGSSGVERATGAPPPPAPPSSAPSSEPDLAAIFAAVQAGAPSPPAPPSSAPSSEPDLAAIFASAPAPHAAEAAEAAPPGPPSPAPPAEPVPEADPDGGAAPSEPPTSAGGSALDATGPTPTSLGAPGDPETRG